MMASPVATPARGEVRGTGSDVSAAAKRIDSIDALRGLVMFTMIFVNDIAGVSNDIVPPWMKHYHGKSGMTFVDLVFPAFLFIVGMSIPFALGSRLQKGEPLWKTVEHVLLRTVSLLFIGILMVNETPDSSKMGWSGPLWCTLMYLSAIFAFCTIWTTGGEQSRGRIFQKLSLGVRLLGWGMLLFLAFSFRGADGHRIVSLSPFSIHTEWYGILGLLGWAYVVGSLVFLLFRNHQLALLGSVVLLMCLYPADRNHTFDDFWLARYVGIGETLGAQAAITVAGMLLATVLLDTGTSSVGSRVRFTVLFVGGCAAGAFLLHGLYGINKNSATPSWCLWACAITALVWLILYFVSDVWRVGAIARPLALAGVNVFLAYLISEMVPSLLEVTHLNGWYSSLAWSNLGCAVARSAGCALAILCVTAGLNRVGFRLKL